MTKWTKLVDCINWRSSVVSRSVIEFSMYSSGTLIKIGNMVCSFSSWTDFHFVDFKIKFSIFGKKSSGHRNRCKSCMLVYLFELLSYWKNYVFWTTTIWLFLFFSFQVLEALSRFNNVFDNQVVRLSIKDMKRWVEGHFISKSALYP